MRLLPSSILAFTLFFAGRLLIAAPPPLFCDNETYPPRDLAWRQNPDLNQISGVFPHPLLPQRVVLTTGTGLSISNDGGNTWNFLPEASTAKLGKISQVAFHPTEPDTFYLASQTKGIWITTDGGNTFRQVGSQANGMAADATRDMIVYPGDPQHQTLLAVHGAAAAGISRSRDGGNTWEVLNTGYFFRRLLAPESGSKALYLFGSTKEEPDIQNLYVCSNLGELAFEVMHDALFTDMTFALARKPILYVATSDSGLYRTESGQFTPEARSLGSKEDSWASIATTWGANADVINLCLYNPSRGGLVFSSDELAHRKTYRGLPSGALVKEGAYVRPNANGTIFYAAVNDSLLVGRPEIPVPVISVTPAAFEPERDIEKKFERLRVAFQEFLRPASGTAKAAGDLCRSFGDLEEPYRTNQLTITAHFPLKPAPPVSVTADLSRLGGSAATPLYDVVKHDGAAAADRVYGFSFCFQPVRYPPREDDWRTSWPGRVAIGVTANFADGTHQGAVGVVGIYPKRQNLNFWGYYHSNFAFKTDGDVTAESVPNPVELHKGPTSALRIHTGHGPWSVLLNIPIWDGDITGYPALSFGLRVGDGPPPKELYVQLRDTPELSEATTTDRIGIFHDGILEGGLTAEYRTVVIPVSKLLGKQTLHFQTSRLSDIIISGDGGDPATLFLDWPCFLAQTAELNPAEKPPSK